MRQQFADELQALQDQLVEMTRLVGSAMERATTALLDADLGLAESVISADEKVDAVRTDFEEHALVLMARQAPVATDLRTLVAGLRMASDLERMGDLARHIAKVARMRYPASAIPAQLRPVILEMGREAEKLVAETGAIIAGKDVVAAAALESADDEMDQLHRGLFTRLLTGTYDTEVVIDVTLLGRYYERYADHAVSVAHRVVFLVTGEHTITEDTVAAS